MHATIRRATVRPDGTRDSFSTETVPARVSPLWWQERGLSFTASGYGRRIPTRYMIRIGKRWRRVYCCQISNAGTCYVGSFGKPGAEIIVSDIAE